MLLNRLLLEDGSLLLLESSGFLLLENSILPSTFCYETVFSIMDDLVVPSFGTISNIPIGVIAELC